MSTVPLTRDGRPARPALNIFLWILRIAVGGLFIFSGIVKANDPSGLANKMVEILEVAQQKWGFHGIANFDVALKLSVVLIALEIIAGIATIIGFAFRFFAWVLLLLNIFFLALTAWIYGTEVMGEPIVRECGCFGDCIKISNAETFWKDVALTVAALILFIYRGRIRPLFPKYPNTAIFILSVFFAFGVQWWMLEHLPYVDCMPYKVGTDINTARSAPSGSRPDSFANVYTLKHLGTGETKEFTQEAYPEDSLWEMVSYDSKLIRKGIYLEPAIKDFTIRANGDTADYANEVLQDPGYKLLLFLRDPDDARTDHMPRLKALFQQAQAAGVTCLILYSAQEEEIARWRAKHGIPGEYYTFDRTASKTAMRSDPGLMLLKGSVVQGKWSFRDYPASVAKNGSEIVVK